jgi:hypothetical protein
VAEGDEEGAVRHPAESEQQANVTSVTMRRFRDRKFKMGQIVQASFETGKQFPESSRMNAHMPVVEVRGHFVTSRATATGTGRLRRRAGLDDGDVT